jgi:hypothetical protein
MLLIQLVGVGVECHRVEQHDVDLFLLFRAPVVRGGALWVGRWLGRLAFPAAEVIAQRMCHHGQGRWGEIGGKPYKNGVVLLRK